ncbi:uncharacterized protein [Gossypium hirsutum]|uniref:RNase H type-1 domain-containing protein n=1 Tax=Gossypium hirsutum TaxID=3635 RepID=A0ABM2Z745_GOSHI|nr:uncharacterized protein LOC121210004 [Gossypium hirsutum]
MAFRVHLEWGFVQCQPLATTVTRWTVENPFGRRQEERMRGFQRKGESVLDRSNNAKTRSREINLISWDIPPVGCCKVNTDGAIGTSTGLASCECVIGDSNGDSVVDFARNVECCSVIDVELSNVFDGLCKAWDMEIRHVLLKVYSLAAIKMLESNQEEPHFNSTVRVIHRLIKSNWDIKVSQKEIN